MIVIAILMFLEGYRSSMEDLLEAPLIYSESSPRRESMKRTQALFGKKERSSDMGVE